MTDKELNKAILNELYKIADEVWVAMKKDVVGSFTAREILSKHLQKDMLLPQGRRITLWHQFSKERTVPSCSLSFCLHAALSFILFYPC